MKNNQASPTRTLGKLIASSLISLAVFGGTIHAATEIPVWRHSGGAKEVAENKAAVEKFNSSQTDWKVVMEVLPQGSYTEAVTAAAVAKKLPCVVELDQPTVANFAWAQHVRPLAEYLPESLLKNLSPGALGKYKDVIYSVGQFDAALALFARKSVMEKYGTRIATMDKPYTKAEFDDILKKLKETGEFKYAIDVKTGYSGEWWPYAYSPWLQSFGGDLINRDNYLEADEILNGDAAINFGNWFQGLFVQGYAERNPSDDQSFIQGRAALDYNGVWMAPGNFDKWGDDLVIMPPPDFGKGPTIGAASWQWGITTTCANPKGAAAFINFLMEDEQIVKMAEATGLIPVTAGAAEKSEKYKTGGAWRVFYQFSNTYAMVRPATPAYPIISSSFEKAMRDIKDGADVIDTLDKAVDTIEQNIEDNDGYGFKE